LTLQTSCFVSKPFLMLTLLCHCLFLFALAYLILFALIRSGLYLFLLVQANHWAKKI